MIKNLTAVCSSVWQLACSVSWATLITFHKPPKPTPPKPTVSHKQHKMKFNKEKYLDRIKYSECIESNLNTLRKKHIL